MPTLRQQARALADQLALDYDDEDLADPYFIGYWSRIAGKARPRDLDRREGWDAAEGELRAERGASS